MASGHLPSPFGLILVRDPIGSCALCECPFYSDRDLRAHFGTIAHREAAQAAIQAEQRRKQRLAFLHDPDLNDVEVEEHLRKVGQRMRREGRWEVRPNEKAGF
jgi:hypothetical protein